VAGVVTEELGGLAISEFGYWPPNLAHLSLLRLEDSVPSNRLIRNSTGRKPGVAQ
jgi:hypothetical protein